MTARKPKPTPADVVPDAPTIAELVDPVGTLEATVDELATNASKVGPLILELTCDGTADLGYFELPDGTTGARVHTDASTDPAELAGFLAALGEPFTLAGRVADESVPAELAETWRRRYARAPRIGD